jgi:flagellar assembly protein FliH
MTAKTFEYPRVPGTGTTPNALDINSKLDEAGPSKSAEQAITKQDLTAAYEHGRKEGHREAEAQLSERLNQVEAAERAKVSKLIADFQQSNAEYFTKVETQLVHLAMSIAGKILHREAQVDPLLVAALVRIATENLKQGSCVRVNIRPEEIPAWRKYYDESGSGHLTVELVEDASLSPGECVVHSEVGSTELGIDAQMKEIAHGLFDLLSQRPQNV